MSDTPIRRRPVSSFTRIIGAGVPVRNSPSASMKGAATGKAIAGPSGSRSIGRSYKRPSVGGLFFVFQDVGGRSDLYLFYGSPALLQNPVPLSYAGGHSGTNRATFHLRAWIAIAQCGGISMNVAGFVGVTDEELVVRAMRDAQSLIAEHIERGPFDAEQAITELMEVLDRQDVVAATDRLCNQFGLRPSRSR